MAEYFIIYRNLEDWDGAEFELRPAPGPDEMVVKEQTIPGEFGFKLIRIKHHHRHIKRDVVNLITYTHEELKARQVRGIANRALAWAKEQETK